MKYLLLPIALLSIKFSFTQHVGIGTNTPKARLHVADSSVVFTSPATLPAIAGNTPISGIGHRMMWYADKAAFRVGFVFDDGWDKQNIGKYSFASGYTTMASGESSTALGFGNQAIGFSSVALGSQTRANANNSTTMGYSTKANAWYSAAAGLGTNANGLGSFVIGLYNDSLVTRSNSVNEQTPLFIIGNGSQSFESNAMVVLKNGNVAIGNNGNPVAPLQVTGGSGLSLANNSGFLTIGNVNASNMVFDNNEIQVRNNGAAANLYLQGVGGKVIIGSGAASAQLFTVNGGAYKNDGSNVWQTNSDARLKKEITPYKDGLTSILKIQPVWFRYNETSGFDMQQKKVGILAQDLQKVATYMVSETSAIKAPDGSNYLSVDNGAMTYMLINAVKEQQQLIEELKKVYSSLIIRLQKLESKK